MMFGVNRTCQIPVGTIKIQVIQILEKEKQMGQTSDKIDQTNGGWPGNMAGPGGAWETQKKEWVALMAARGYPNADITNQNSLGKPISAPMSVIANPGLPVEPPNAETPLAHNPDGSVTGRMAGSSVVFNLPTPKA
jgi:hypothetical protein